jgi:hypothetical protein
MFERLFFSKILWRLHKMSDSMDRLVAEVSQTRTAVDSILALVSGLADQLRATAGDASKVIALADQLDAMQTDLAAAVTANTPAAPVDPAPVDVPPAA